MIFQFMKTQRKIKQLTTLAYGSHYSRSQRGVYKHIDENRQLLELLLEDVPDLLKEKPWIIGWFQSRDDFLTMFAEIMEPENYITGYSYPRPWPIIDLDATGLELHPSLKEKSQSTTKYEE